MLLRSSFRRSIVVFLVMALLAGLSFSCQKDLASDNIYVQTFTPEVVLTATKHYVDSPFYCQQMPVPTDSVATYQLDMNNDGIPDFLFAVERWTWQGQGSSFQLDPCLNHQNFSTFIKPVNEANEIAYIDPEPFPQAYLNGKLIHQYSSWHGSQIGPIVASSLQWMTQFKPQHEAFFIGVRILVEGQYQYGWIEVEAKVNEIRIRSTGLNRSGNYAIRAGQLN